ncbi:MAG: methylenetetrahydrofolate reductase [NAD(P)H] [Pirellulaceae bacterium]|nr:methylenetetrahydrofolate reductase [NAD(P)H] [Pirellulaceae bacterium]
MNLSSLYDSGKTVLSFELFPPKSEEGVGDLMRAVEELARYKPDYFTCTYGAGGSTRDRTLSIAANVRRDFSIPVASHLTCVGSTVDQLRGYLADARAAGIDYIVALRGDPPQGDTQFKPVVGGLQYANQLVSLVRSEFPDFGVAVAGYPEVHQEAPNADVDLQNLVRKVQCGADIVITQLFYDNADFFQFRQRCVQAGITVPIVPGLLPVLSLGQVQRITKLCKAKLPETLVERLSHRDDSQWQFQVGVQHALAQAQELIEAGVPGIHFYVLNRSTATSQILDNLSLDSASAR